MTKPAQEPYLAVFLTWTDMVADLHGLSPEDAHRVKLAVEEAIANVVKHAYANGDQGDVTLIADVSDEAVTFTVEDRGTPFHPDAAPRPDLTSAWSERPVGGLGWHFIRELADDVGYELIDGRNRLTLRFARSARP